MWISFGNAFILSISITFVFCAYSTNDALSERQKLVQRHLKRAKKDEGAIRLVGGKEAHEGNVEIFHKGKWGNICDDEWDKYEAEVVCKQLNYHLGGKATHSGLFGKARRKFWMDNLYCTGQEKQLSQCRFDGWGQSDCEQSEAAGVVCNVEKEKPAVKKDVKVHSMSPKFKYNSKENMKVRLVGGRVAEEGRVEVKFGNGPYGDICGDGWSLIEANVICKELNLGYANEAFQTNFFGGSNGSHILLTGTECIGNETKLSDCKFEGFGKHGKCHGNKHHVAGVSCVKRMPDLVIDETELETTAHLEDRPLYFLTCAMEENCVASQAYEIQKENTNWHLETRRLLKFTAKVLNNGTDDFRPHIPKNLWEFHLCHMHYHSMEVFATFDIINDKGEKVAEGHKASFCLEDNLCLEGVEARYACANYGDQGISVGCYDIYKYNIDCQWIDITEIDFGQYIFKVSINPEHKVPEMTFENNAATCTLLYTQQFARVYDCKVGRP
ncbi:CLUMA_CG007163, isoform A [Clunio marinus]|uniref:CLUMA_CG007163, isoform A n=1 Tax=Clunio marinus TaxID=568069 RepID=A0A1J1I5J6_9DIPT|nr:CLUMA_CG007163, isoform A [Clunio marinus]